MRTVALVGDLMDRTKLTGAIGDVEFVAESAGCAGADTVIVDLVRHGDTLAEVRALVPDARIVCFGPHVDGEAAEGARAAGADVVLPRSRFFRDPAAHVASGR